MRNFLIILGAHAVILAFIFINFWLAILLLLLLHGVILYNLLRPRARLFNEAICHFQTKKREVWLTIDDGVDPRSTSKILALLAKYNARATFFIIGEKAKRHPQCVQEILAANCSIGNHTFSHRQFFFWALGRRTLAKEVDEAQQILSKFASCSYFRPPVGFNNIFLNEILRKHGLRHILWSARGFDTRTKSITKILAKIERDLQCGAIILIHEHLPNSPEVLEKLLLMLRKKDYDCVLPSDSQF